MSPIYIKQQISQVEEGVLRSKFKVTSDPEVNRYNYGTILGTLQHIDYAIPLFGYARESKQKAEDIYEHIKDSILEVLPCETEFVNGYMNIFVKAEYLEQVLGSQLGGNNLSINSDNSASTLVLSSNKPSAKIACKLVHQSLSHIGTEAEVLDALPSRANSASQYIIESDSYLRESLLKIDGVIGEPDSKVMYLQQGNEPHALRSVKGGWYAAGLVIAAVQQAVEQENRVFVFGSSEANQLIRALFPQVSCFDVDVHAKHIDQTFHKKTVEQLIDDAKTFFKGQDLSKLDTKHRRALVHMLDFEYEILEAYKSGDLKRMVGEITNLVRQHPVSDIS